MKGYTNGILLLIAGIFAVFVLSPGCIGNEDAEDRAKSGDLVKVHYTGTFDNGTVFDSSMGGEPLEFTVGGGEMIPGFDAAVVGMRIGETKTVRIPADQAYGPYQEELVFVTDPAGITGGENLTVGDQVAITLADGRAIPGRVTTISPGEVTIDANHPLAGEDLTFVINLVEIG